ncbi:selection and upkeep of intraepithelial T-cells protein 2, partial [Xenopus tropicalis]|uniref:Selection and upkeep of intraepithelial T-cells protein 2 n=2 Tax=Xenopus tropicalis TaxID=8364 RepID=A0A8J1IPF4_XENTR
EVGLRGEFGRVAVAQLVSDSSARGFRSSVSGFGSDSVPVPLGPYTHSHLLIRFQVSSTPSVSVALGSDVLLPCTLTPEKNGEKMEIRWFKKIFQPYVHLYINGKDDYTAQMPQFANRTELLKENITRGIFPLKIHKVTAEDSGEYYCYVESSDHHSMAAVQLQVTAVGTVPVISITNDNVSCESRDWNPKPHLTWTDNEGNKINSSMVEVLRDENNLYYILSIIQQPSASNITCTVSNSINHCSDTRQIRGLEHSQTSRGTHSRVYVIGASFLLIFCICFLLRSLANGTLHTEASYSPA